MGTGLSPGVKGRPRLNYMEQSCSPEETQGGPRLTGSVLLILGPQTLPLCPSPLRSPFLPVVPARPPPSYAEALRLLLCFVCNAPAQAPAPPGSFPSPDGPSPARLGPFQPTSHVREGALSSGCMHNAKVLHLGPGAAIRELTQQDTLEPQVLRLWTA